MSVEPSSTVPCCGETKPVSALINVVFPAPLAPTTPTRCPGATRTVTASRALMPPKSTVIARPSRVTDGDGRRGRGSEGPAIVMDGVITDSGAPASSAGSDALPAAPARCVRRRRWRAREAILSRFWASISAVSRMVAERTSGWMRSGSRRIGMTVNAAATNQIGASSPMPAAMGMAR
jgi:hypothetical protein